MRIEVTVGSQQARKMETRRSHRPRSLTAVPAVLRGRLAGARAVWEWTGNGEMKAELTRARA